MHRRLALAAVTSLAVLAAGAGFASSSATAAPAERSARDTAIDHARANLRAHADRTGAGPDEEFAVRDVILDADGSAHVRFDRTYRGLPVLGGDLVVHDNRDGALVDVSRASERPVTVSTRPTVPAQQAAATAAAEFDGAATSSTPALAVYALTNAPTLSWQTRVEGVRADGNAGDITVVVDASSGRVIDGWDNHETGTGVSGFLGTVPIATSSTGAGFELRDTTRGGTYTTDLNNGTSGVGALFTSTDDAWGNGSFVTSRETAAVDAHFGIGATWDYFKAAFGRNGIGNDGKGAYARVHYGTNYDNAFWSDSCFCMTFGDGDGSTDWPLVSLDIAGHEMTHGVTSRTANLTYRGESGGLNEATSDIFGTMVEFSAGNAADPGDYEIGEEIFRSYNGSGFRHMYRPSLDGRSKDCWSKQLGTLDVHYSSGVANHFFYLLAEGSAANPASPTCNGRTVAGIGRAAAAKIWYDALTKYMTSSTNYAGARAATLQAAGSSSTQVAAAWDAVNVLASTGTKGGGPRAR